MEEGGELYDEEVGKGGEGTRDGEGLEADALDVVEIVGGVVSRVVGAREGFCGCEEVLVDHF